MGDALPWAAAYRPRFRPGAVGSGTRRGSLLRQLRRGTAATRTSVRVVRRARPKHPRCPSSRRPARDRNIAPRPILRQRPPRILLPCSSSDRFRPEYEYIQLVSEAADQLNALIRSQVTDPGLRPLADARASTWRSALSISEHIVGTDRHHDAASGTGASPRARRRSSLPMRACAELFWRWSPPALSLEDIRGPAFWSLRKCRSRHHPFGLW